MVATSWSSIVLAQDGGGSGGKEKNPPDKKDEGPKDELLGHEVRLERVDGQAFVGTLVRRDREVIILRIVGIDTKFDPYDVVRITREKTFVEYYQEMRSSVPRHDFEGRYKLCLWVYERAQYELAEAELVALLTDEPGHEKARTLLARVRASLELQKEREARQKEGVGTSGHEEEVAGDGAPDLLTEQQRLRTYLLTKEQMNVLRVYEVDLREPPSMQIPNSAIEMLLKSYEGNELIPTKPDEQRLFFRKPANEILGIMFRLRARELYPMVRVIGEPESLNVFRHQVHRTWLVNSCASDQCHGNRSTSGRLFLYNRPPGSDAVVYTNYLILERTETSGGEPLIDFLHPERSPLLQAGLPREIALKPHPDVAGWRPAFDSVTDPMLEKAIDWIRLLYRPRLEEGYPIEFTPPGLMQRPGEVTEQPGATDSGSEQTGRTGGADESENPASRDGKSPGNPGR